VPHLTIEHSLPADSAEVATLVKALHRVLTADPLFEVGAVRVRAVACHPVAIADLHPDNGFVAMVLRIGAGRALQDRQRLGAAVMLVAEQVLADRLAGSHFALSLDMVENDPNVSWKVNTIHARLRQAGR
jgi:5-carboxymethyl-2-hydroxymuconate isomerase